MSNPARVEASLTTRAQVWFHSQPLLTKSVLLLCSSLSVLALLTGWEVAQSTCLAVSLIVRKFQLYRIFTSAVVHNGILHVVFNMLAFVPSAAALERQLGSIQLLYLLLLFTIVGDCFFILGSSLADWLIPATHPGCAVGLSGVIFALIVVETQVSGATHRSIFGFFSVPAQYYPWALLVLWQLLLPHISFFGHLGGILAGQLYVWGYLRRLMPSTAAFQAVERWGPLQRCTSLPSFVSCGGTSLLPTSVAASDSGSGGLSPGWQPPQAWGRQGLPGWLRLPSSDPDAAPPAPARAGGSTDAGGKAAGKAYVLGGSSSSPPVVGVAPQRAAAAAAEARAQRGAGSQAGPAKPPPTGEDKG